MEVKESYYIEGPRLGNQFTEDVFLISLLREICGQVLDHFAEDLIRFGAKVSGEYLPMMKDAEINPPRLVSHSPWGERTNELLLSEGWKFFKRETATEKLVSLPYQNKFKQLTRVYYFAKIFLFHPSSALASCPVAMTDGSLHLLHSRLAIVKNPKVRIRMSEAIKHLSSNNSAEFWTSGQWMTEKQGGSDVGSATETVAVVEDEPAQIYRLFGVKFFTSATDSEVAIGLARIVKHKDDDFRNVRPSLFLIFLRKEGKLDGIDIIRLKEKLGTRQLPTAELHLKGAMGVLISDPGVGVKEITKMVNITRIHNAVAAVASMRRITHLARDYALKRSAFGKLLVDLPLQNKLLSEMEFDTRGGMVMCFEAARLLGRIENEIARPIETATFRLLIPLLKLFTAKEGVRVASEGIECFGGLGYMEDSFIPQILRDVQVTPIWEGTTHVQSVDFLRALQKEDKGIEVLQGLLSNTSTYEFSTEKQQIRNKIEETLQFLASAKPIDALFNAKSICFNLSRAFICHFLHQMSFETPDIGLLLQHWYQRTVREWLPFEPNAETRIQTNREMLKRESFGTATDSQGDPRPKL